MRSSRSVSVKWRSLTQYCVGVGMVDVGGGVVVGCWDPVRCFVEYDGEGDG